MQRRMTSSAKTILVIVLFAVCVMTYRGLSDTISGIHEYRNAAWDRAGFTQQDLRP